MRHTSARIARILDVNRAAPTSGSWASAVSIVAVLTLGCGVFYSRTPGLVAFWNSGDSPKTEMVNMLAHEIPAAASPHSVPLIEAKFSQHSTLVKSNAKLRELKRTNADRRLALETKSTKEKNDTLVHLTGSKRSTVPATETFWVVVQSEQLNPAAPPVYQIQMWRVTVLRTVVTAPSRQIPRSET